MGCFIHKRENIRDFLVGRSRCESCNYVIPFYLNVPVISYLILRGRCKNCGDRISIFIFLYEIVTAFAFLLLYLKYKLSLEFIIRSVQTLILLLISFTDFREKKVYTVDILALAVIELMYLLIFKSDISKYIFSALILLSIYYLIYKLSGSMGEADVLLGAVSGLFCKSYLEVFYIFRNTFILAALVGVFLILIGKKSRKDELAFCPYICLSIFGVIL